jgi:disease resistance protein RPM1
VEIEEGALGSLVELRLEGCPELKRLPRGIEYLSTLDELYLDNAVDELIKILRQQGETKECKVLMKISHIRKVVFYVTGENVWRRIVITEGNAFVG